MPIRRMDHRARFRAAYLNNAIDQVNQLNKTRFNLNGGVGGSFGVGGSVSFSQVYEFGDYIYLCPPGIENREPTGAWFHDLWLKRMATPTWGSSHSTTRSQSIQASNYRYNARGGFYDSMYEAAGWGGWDASSTSTGDLLTGGSYIFDGIESEGYQIADVLDGWNPVTNPYPGGFEAGYEPWTAENWNYGSGFVNQCDEYPNILTRTFGPPLSGLHWGLKATDGGVASIFPYDPGGRPGGGNHVMGDLGFAQFNLETTPVGFMHLLQALPPGATIVKCMIPVKLSSFVNATWSTSPTVNFNEETHAYSAGQPPVNKISPWEFDDGYTYNSSNGGSVSFALMGRYLKGTRVEVGTDRIKRITGWDFIGSMGGITVSSDTWVVIDVKPLCDMFLALKTDHSRMNAFGFFPSIDGESTSGVGTTGWLEGLVAKPASIIAQNPHWHVDPETGPNPFKELMDPFDDYKWIDFDLMYNAGYGGQSVSWGSLVFGEGVIEWTYPSSIQNRVLTYTQIVRGDSPILG